MDLIQPGTAFCFNYTAFDQDETLFVATRVYDITSGSAVFVTQVAMTEIQNGLYSGNFIGLDDKTYITISLVFTDGTYSSVNSNRPPAARCFQAVQEALVEWAFNYVNIDQEINLNIAATVFDLSSGSSVFVEQIALQYIVAGVYFGVFEGEVGKTYEINSLVYTDDTLSTVDTDYAPGTDSFSSFLMRVVQNNFVAATLTGQNVEAVLLGQSLNATLIGT